jgi:hypothetical protein
MVDEIPVLLHIPGVEIRTACGFHLFEPLGKEHPQIGHILTNDLLT